MIDRHLRLNTSENASKETYTALVKIKGFGRTLMIKALPGSEACGTVWVTLQHCPGNQWFSVHNPDSHFFQGLRVELLKNLREECRRQLQLRYAPCRYSDVSNDGHCTLDQAQATLHLYRSDHKAPVLLLTILADTDTVLLRSPRILEQSDIAARLFHNE